MFTRYIFTLSERAFYHPTHRKPHSNFQELLHYGRTKPHEKIIRVNPSLQIHSRLVHINNDICIAPITDGSRRIANHKCPAFPWKRLQGCCLQIFLCHLRQLIPSPDRLNPAQDFQPQHNFISKCVHYGPDLNLGLAISYIS